MIGSGLNPSTCASGVNGRIAPSVAMAVGVISIARLGRLWKNGTRRVRMRKTTRVWVASDSTNQPVRNSEWPGVQDPQHHEEGQEVEDRADRPEHRHEPADEADVPGGGAGDGLGVDPVGRDRQLADVVEQVVEEDLGREHRQERQEERCAGGAEHVPEVRRRRHQDVLHACSRRCAAPRGRRRRARRDPCPAARCRPRPSRRRSPTRPRCRRRRRAGRPHRSRRRPGTRRRRRGAGRP